MLGALPIFGTEKARYFKGRYTLPVFTGVSTAREHGCHFGHLSCKYKIIMTSLTITPADLDGPFSRLSKMTPVFTGRVHGP